MYRRSLLVAPVALAVLGACSPKPAEEAPRPVATAVPAGPTATAIAVVSAAPTPTPAPAPPPNRALELERASDFAGAAALYEKACGAGDGAACRHLARMVHEGLGVPRHRARALSLEQKACDLGDGLACARIGERLEMADEVFPDKAKALAAYQRAIPLLDTACKAGSGPSCARLGELVFNGKGGARDAERADAAWKRAMEAYGKACDGGDGDACLELGILRSNHRGAAQDAADAAALYDKGCKLGSAAACYELALGLQQQPERARAAFLRHVTLLEKACEAGSVDTCARISLVYSVSLGDKGRSALWERVACARGSGLACRGVAKQLERGDALDARAPEAAYAQAFQNFEKACEAGDGNACSWLGLAWLFGEGVKADAKKGHEATERGCDLADAGSCLTLADDVASGRRGLKKDPARAKELYEKACALGRKMACEKAQGG